MSTPDMHQPPGRLGRVLWRTLRVVRTLPYGRLLRGNYLGLLQRLWHIYRQQGMPGIGRLLRRSTLTATSTTRRPHAIPSHNDYGKWIAWHDTLGPEQAQAIMGQVGAGNALPVISIILAVDAGSPALHLEEAIAAVRAQLNPGWELCIAVNADAGTDVGKCILERLQRASEGDQRIGITYLPAGATAPQLRNAALARAKGEFVLILTHELVLREHALFLFARVAQQHARCYILYADEDRIDQAKQRHDPYFKSEWNPELFLSHDYINGPGVYRTSLVRQLAGWRDELAGAEDYDLALRCAAQLEPDQIVHLPRVLAHRWREDRNAASQASNPTAQDAARRALDDHYRRAALAAHSALLASGMQRPFFALPEHPPLVSLIIPTRNGLQLIRQCIDSIVAKTRYPHYEIIIVDNNSDDPDTLAYFRSLSEDPRIRVLRDEQPFNYSALNNGAVRQARGEYVALVNNDIVVIAPTWLDEMIGLAMQPAIGAVGARLWYADDTLQHAGVVTGIFGIGGHVHRFLPKGEPGYRSRAELIQSVSVVTAACLLIRKRLYEEIGGLDEEHLKVAFNDVDFCLRLREAGYRNVWTPYAELYHLESATRGQDDTPVKKQRFQAEVDFMMQRWGALLEQDPAYNPNLTLESEHFELAWPPRAPPITG